MINVQNYLKKNQIESQIKSIKIGSEKIENLSFYDKINACGYFYGVIYQVWKTK